MRFIDKILFFYFWGGGGGVIKLLVINIRRRVYDCSWYINGLMIILFYLKFYLLKVLVNIIFF